MKFALVHPSYFPNIATFAVIVQHNVQWEIQDNFQKQTYRNRCYIATDRGKHMMNLPIQHVGKSQGRQQYKEVALDNTYPWQRQHWRTLQTAYRTSPFFEYYEDDIAPLFKEPQKRLLEFNLQSIRTVCSCLQIQMPEHRTSEFQVVPDTSSLDFRFLIDAKKELPLKQPPYTHVFGERHGFLENLSILDLLFNEGPQALEYLKKMTIPSLV